MDLDADILVLLYHYRWKIELFFRWLKCTMKCAHLFCESENGMKIQFYAALIASLLVLLYTGRKPCKRIWEALQLHFAGWAEWKDVEFYIAKYGKPALP
jgi:IS4 transposase